MIDEKITLNNEEKNLLTRIVQKWKTDQGWFEISGTTRGGANELDYKDRYALRTLIRENLVFVKQIPSAVNCLIHPNPIQLNINGMFVPINLPTQAIEPMIFDLIIKPTKKGRDHCFVEQL